MSFLVKFKENVENLSKISLKNGTVKYGLVLCDAKLGNRDLILLVTSYSKDLQNIDSEFLYHDEISEIDILQIEVEK